MVLSPHVFPMDLFRDRLGARLFGRWGDTRWESDHGPKNPADRGRVAWRGDRVSWHGDLECTLRARDLAASICRHCRRRRAAPQRQWADLSAALRDSFAARCRSLAGFQPWRLAEDRASGG